MSDITIQDVFEAVRTADASVAIDLEGRFPLPNIVAVVENLMEATTPPMRIGRKTILAILKKLSAPERALANPQEFAAALVTAADSVPLDAAELDNAQGACASVAVGGQGGQAQEAKVLGRKIGPRVGLLDDLLRSGVGIVLWFWAVSHTRRSCARHLQVSSDALIGRRSANWRLAFCRCAG